MKRAMFIQRAKIGVGDALLYKLSDPVKVSDIETNTVIISAVTAPVFGEKVTMFPAKDDGTLMSFEAVAEKMGTLDHEEVLVDLGYEIM